MDAGNEIVHNPDNQRFETKANSESAYVAYAMETGSITLKSTYVAPALRGGALAARLVSTALDYARSKGLKVRSTCSYVDRFLQRHPEYSDLTAP
ncbi:MAG: GNAT family N-acetyltransferase [Pseudomonadota bacterium]